MQDPLRDKTTDRFSGDLVEFATTRLATDLVAGHISNRERLLAEGASVWRGDGDTEITTTYGRLLNVLIIISESNG